MTTQSEETKLAVITTKLDYISQKVDSIETNQKSSYVSKEEFEPIKRLVYGVVGLVGVVVMGALLSLVIRR